MSSGTASSRNREWKAPTTIFNGMFISIFIANMLLNMCQQMSNVQLPLYAKALGSSAGQIGSLVSMFAITAFIFRFFSGPAMNSFNRKILVSISIAIMAAAYFGFAMSPAIAQATGLETITVMKMFRLLQGVGNAFANSTFMTMVADVLPKDKFTSGMGFYACAQVVAQALGPVVGEFLGRTLGFRNSYILVALATLATILAAVPIRLAPRSKVKFSLNLKNILAWEALVPAGAIVFLHVGFTSIGAFLLVYAQEHGIEGASAYFTVYAVSMLVTRPLVGRLTDKYGFVKVGIPAACVTALSLMLIGYSTSLPMLLAVGALNAFGYGACQPALQSLCMKSVPPERRGSASSTSYIGQDIATIAGPSVCGAVANAVGYTPAMWLVMTVPILMGACFIFIFRSRINKIENDFQLRSNSAG